MKETPTLASRVASYKAVLENTATYRKAWHDMVKPLLLDSLNTTLKEVGLTAEVKVQEKLQNLEAVVVDLGKTSSGISEVIENSGVHRTMIKNNGALIYQQLFNGKIMVMVLPPSIEGYGEPKAPRSLEILRPHELNPSLLNKHLETLLKEVIDWEDYDDDEPSKQNIGFNPIGYIKEEEA
jgi:hypothetical protein